MSDNAAGCLGVAVARRLVVIATGRDARLSMVATVTAVRVRRSWAYSHTPVARTCRQQRHLIGQIRRPTRIQ